MVIYNSVVVYLIKNNINLKNNTKFNKNNKQDIDKLTMDLSNLKNKYWRKMLYA